MFKNNSEWLDKNGSVPQSPSRKCATKGCRSTAVYAVHYEDRHIPVCSCCHIKYEMPFAGRVALPN